jgi:hypothetical protein
MDPRACWRLKSFSFDDKAGFRGAFYPKSRTIKCLPREGCPRMIFIGERGSGFLKKPGFPFARE